MHERERERERLTDREPERTLTFAGFWILEFDIVPLLLFC